jgi:two-component system alkaline phosphatase synthesis response regulator PhoP
MKKILIVEDDEKIAMALAIRLRAAGYEALLARDGEKGLQLARNSWPDLILLDIGLPLMDIWMPLGVGYSVARRLKSIGRGSIPIIFITASKESGLREAALKVGAAGFFEKPYNPDELLKAIAQILSRDGSSSPDHESAAGLSQNLKNYEANPIDRRR